MKKRVLSLLLAIVMVVTALPLLIFTAMAEEPEAVQYPATSKEEYNDLYVKEGLTFAVDYFFANKHWNEEAPMPVSPYELEEYDTEAERWDITYDADGVTEASRTLKTAYKDAVSNYFNGASGHSLRVWAQSKIWHNTSGGNIWMSTNNGTISTEAAVLNSHRATFYLAEGYIQFVRGMQSNVYMNVNGSHATDWDATYTMQAVMQPSNGGETSMGSFAGQYDRDNWLLFRGLSFRIALNGNDENTFVLSNSSYSGTTYTLPETAVPFSKTAIATFTLENKNAPAKPASGETATGSVRLLYNSTELLKSAVTYTSSSNLNTLFNFSNSTTAGLYAYRIYNGTLSELQLAQNHFADLAKWFRLDISSYKECVDRLDDAQRLAAFKEFAAFTFDSKREDVQDAVDVVFEEALLGDEYYAGFEGAVEAHALAVAKRFKLDIDVLKIMPKSFMQKTNAWFASIDLADETLEKTAVQAAYIRVVEEDVWGYAGESTLSAAGYNALYETTGLVVAYDFFDSNKHWGGAYSDGTFLQMTGSVNPSSSGNQNNITAYRTHLAALVRDFFGQNGANAPLPTLHDGYLDFVYASNSSFTSNGIGYWGRTSDGYLSSTLPGGGGFLTDTAYTLTSQVVAKYSSLDKNNNPDFTLGRLAVKLNTSDGVSYISAVNDTASFTADSDYPLSANDGNRFMLGKTVGLTTVINQPIGADAAVAQPGLLGLYVDEKTAYENESFAYTQTASVRNTDYQFLYTGAYAAHTYAFRLYNVVLTADGMERNHFADVAKWYKLGLVGWSDLDDDQKETVYAAFADVTVDDDRYTRTEVQAMYVAAIDAMEAAKYEQYKNGDADHDAFIDVAAVYRLDVEAIVNATVDMTYVYKNVTMETLDGLTRAEAQAVLDRAVELAVKYTSSMNGDPAHDAFVSLAAEYGLDILAILESRRDLSTLYAAVTAEAVAGMDKAAIQALVNEKFALAHDYYSYKDGSAQNDAFIDAAAEAGIAIEGLMALPKAERSEAYALDLNSLKGDKEAFQLAVDAAVIKAMEKYAAYATPSITEEQYNALYVTNGLTMQLDFFKTNKYWAPNGHDLAMPENLYEMKDGEGNLLFDELDERIVTTVDEESGAVTARDFTASFNELRSLYNKEADAYLLNFHVTLPGQARKMYYAPGYTGTAGHLDSTGVGQRLPFFLADEGGYITMNAPHTNTYMGITGNETFGGTTTIQMVADAGTARRNGALVHRGLLFGFADSADGVIFTTGTNYGFSFSNEGAVAVPADKVGTYSFEVYHPEVADLDALKAATTSKVNIRFNDLTVLDTAINTASAGSLHAATLVNFSSGSNQNVYAIRYYNRHLNDDELALNHFADIAKFFKLDVSAILGATVEARTELALAFAEYDVSVATSTREEAQAAYEAALYEAYEALYMGANEDVDKIVALAAFNNVDISKVVILPIAMITEIAKGLNAEFDANYANDHAILTYYLEAMLDELLGSVSLKEYTQEDYNKLYAQQEHLTLWFDFFSATEGMIDSGRLNTDKTAFTSAEVPSVFRAGKMQITNISPTTNTYDRAMLNGFFRMHATATSGTVVYPNIEVLPDERYVATDLYYSDYTWEVVASDFEGHNQNMQIDNVRLAFGANGDKVRFSAIYKNDIRVSSGSFDDMKAANVYASSAGTVGEEVNYAVSPALGSTITLRFDKDFTVSPVSYFKVTPDADGKYAEKGRAQITLDEAKELLGFEGTADELNEYLGLPAREALTESYANSLSQFIANDEGVYVYAVRYPAEAKVNVQLNGIEHFNDKMTAGVGSGYVLTGIGTGVNMNVYSLRRYDIVLTDAELLQNHFVDLCKYYNLDITAYLAMDEAARAEVHLAMKDFLIKDDAAAVNAAWKVLVKEYYYDVLKAGYAEEFNGFFDKAAASQVDLTALLSRPASLHTSVMNVFDDMPMGTDRLVMEMLLQNALAAIEKTEEEMALELVSFDGYQVRLAVGAVKMPGIRANFIVDEAVLEALEAAGYKVSFGASVTGNETATLTVYDGSEYVGETYNRLGANQTAELCFTYTTVFDEDSLRNKENYDKELTYEYWVTLEKQGEDPATFRFGCESARFGSAVCAAEVYDYFRDDANYAADAMVYEVTSATAEKQLVDMTVNGKNVAAYTLVYDDIFTEEMALEIADAIEELTGTKISVIARGAVNRPNAATPAIWLMGKKNVYPEVTALSGGDFAWFNEVRTGSFGIAVLDLDKLDGFVAAVKAELAAAVSEGKLTLGSTDGEMAERYFNAAVAE